MRPINSMIEFKQIIGRGTRLFDGKEFFTIYDFVNAYHHFKDPEWDGEPVEPIIYDPEPLREPPMVNEPDIERPKKQKIRVKLRDGKEHEIQHTVDSTFFSADGKPMTAQEFLNSLFGTLPEFFKNEEELRKVWSNPITRKVMLDKLADAGFGKDELTALQKIVDAEKSDLFDVLEYISFSIKPITREMRVANAQQNIFAVLNPQQKEFLEFVLSKYIETGVEELDQEKLPGLLELKYHAINDAADKLGTVSKIRELFIDFQKYLYQKEVA
jgi:type I restriction enzyme R subunit